VVLAIFDLQFQSDLASDVFRLLFLALIVALFSDGVLWIMYVVI
jgi:hypothetical protein